MPVACAPMPTHALGFLTEVLPPAPAASSGQGCSARVRGPHSAAGGRDSQREATHRQKRAWPQRTMAIAHTPSE